MPKTPPPSAKLITSKSNIRYISNFTGSAGFMLLTKTKKYLLTDFRYIERAKNTIKKDIEIIDTTKLWRNPKTLKENWQKLLNKHKITTLGIEEDHLTVSEFKKFKKISPKIKFKNISGITEKLREVKSENELKLIKKSQKINDEVLKEIKALIQRKGATPSEIEIAWKIKELGHQLGAEGISFEPIVGFGANSAIVHHSPTTKKLEKGDIALIDMGMKFKGYCSDMTRIIFTKKPTPKQAEIYNLVLRSQETSIKTIKAGITGSEIDQSGRKIIKDAGYGENYGHAGGHGVGLDIHETPSISENYTETIKENTVITVEPGIYLPKQFGIRIEDMLQVTKNGSKNLTKTTKNI